MAIHDVSIKKALSSQTDLITDLEHCSVDPNTLTVIGCALGYQLRIKRNSDERGLYTVSEVGQDNPDNVVRMGLGGRNDSARALSSMAWSTPKCQMQP
jgi:hypothetical protein